MELTIVHLVARNIHSNILSGMKEVITITKKRIYRITSIRTFS